MSVAIPSFLTGRGALVVVLVFMVVAAIESWPNRRIPTNLEGYVYERCTNHRLVGPVEGADVSTSIDATTAKSDATGHFRLKTNTALLNDQSYSVTVRAHGVAVSDYFLVGPSSPVRSSAFPIAFALSTLEPLIVGLGHDQNHAPTPNVLFCMPRPVGQVGPRALL
jgi:hypothetical protein